LAAMRTGPASAADNPHAAAPLMKPPLCSPRSGRLHRACSVTLPGRERYRRHPRPGGPLPPRPTPGAGGTLGGGRSMFSGFKNFLMRGDIVVVAVGLAVALAFSALIASFTTNIINPVVSRAQGGHAVGLGVQLGNAGNKATFLNIGALISSIIYFFV